MRCTDWASDGIRGNKFQPNKIARKVPKTREEYTQIDPKLKANMDWMKATRNDQIASMQYSQLLMKLVAK
jgi:hypothetical protein